MARATVIRWGRDLALVTIAVALVGIALALLRGGAFAGLPAGLGGAIGLIFSAVAEHATVLLPSPQWVWPVRAFAALLVAVGGITLWAFSLRLDAIERDWLLRPFRSRPSTAASTALVRAKRAQPRPVAVPVEDKPRPVIAEPAKAKADTSRAPRDRQAKLDLRDTYTLPALDLLKAPPPSSGNTIDRAALERNARLLESVLDDFHVKGRIIEVRPGPVVTMYELEPASGIKASRVIALADDIARNMSRVVRPCRDHSRTHRDRHRAAQRQARIGRAVRTGQQRRL